MSALTNLRRICQGCVAVAMILILLSVMACRETRTLTPPDTDKPADSCPLCDKEAAVETNTDLADVAIPDVEVTDQNGRKLRFYSDLVKGKIAAINSFFTTCTTSCPIMGTNFGELQKLLGKRLGPEVSLISISVDPVQDTPARLKLFADRYGAGPGWTLVTGAKDQIDTLLRALQAYTPNKTDHPSLIVLVDGVHGKGMRTSGLAAPAKLAQALANVQAASAKSATALKSPARNYFTDTVLLNQDGKEVRFYTDLIHGKVVVINVFFTTCNGSCLVMNNTLAKIQDHLGDRFGKDVHLITITVDPANDTPAKLHAYATKFKARPGWHFLTGEPAKVNHVLHKLGQFVDNKETHSSILFMGNDRTGLWKKGFGLAESTKLIQMVDGVVNDRGAE